MTCAHLARHFIWTGSGAMPLNAAQRAVILRCGHLQALKDDGERRIAAAHPSRLAANAARTSG